MLSQALVDERRDHKVHLGQQYQSYRGIINLYLLQIAHEAMRV